MDILAQWTTDSLRSTGSRTTGGVGYDYVVEGELVLISDDGEEILTTGMCAGFPVRRANGHHLVNRPGSTASYLEIGTRSPNERSHYPDVDLETRKVGDGFRFTHRDGEPYET